MEATPAPESPENEPPAPTSVSSHKGNSSGVGTPERPDLSPRALREQLRIPEPDPKAARWPNDLRTADVIVLFQPSHQTFYLHRTVLATGSGFFQSAFSSGFKDSTSGYFEVSMRNSDLAIRSCIQFLYDEFSENEPDEEAPRLVQSVGAGSKTIDLLQAADFFDMPRLIDVCCERIVSDWKNIMKAPDFNSNTVPQHLLEKIMAQLPKDDKAGVYWRVRIILNWGVIVASSDQRELIEKFVVPLRTDADYLSAKNAQLLYSQFGPRIQNVLTFSILTKLMR